MPKSDNRNKERSKDWKEWTSGWQYERTAPFDTQWKKDRAELFKKNGNGWWWYEHKSHNPYLSKEKDNEQDE